MSDEELLQKDRKRQYCQLIVRSEPRANCTLSTSRRPFPVQDNPTLQ